MNEFYDSTASRCVALVERMAKKAMWSNRGITPAELAKHMRSGAIVSIVAPPSDGQITTIIHKKCFGPAGANQLENIAATEEILALGSARKYGDAYKIVTKHKAHIQTVYKMVWKRENPLGVWKQRSKVQ